VVKFGKICEKSEEGKTFGSDWDKEFFLAGKDQLRKFAAPLKTTKKGVLQNCPCAGSRCRCRSPAHFGQFCENFGS